MSRIPSAARARPLVAALFVLALLVAHGARVSLAREPAVAIDAPPPSKAQRQTATPMQTPPAPRTQVAPGKDAARDARAAVAPINGRVVGDAGEPLAGVSVYVLPQAPGQQRSPRVVTADDEGAFQVTGLEPGLYMLNATLPGYVSDADPLTGRPAATYRPGDNAVVRLTKGGVITGTVTDQQGEPIVGLSVRAFRVRDLDGGAQQTPFTFSLDDRTDDRGVYRIYGLRPGLYVVFAGGAATSSFGLITAYGGDAPTFYPSGTRDTASEVSVRAGQETAGIDIRYREEQGHRVTGALDLPNAAPGDLSAGVTLTFASTGMVAGSAGVNPNSTEHSFSFEGIADGEYDLQATGGNRDGLTGASAPQRVSVRGADVTGLRVTLTPLASASGVLVIEPASESDRARDACKAARATQLPQETLITIIPERARAASNRPVSRLLGPRDVTPEATGAFMLRSLEPGRYRLAFRLFDEALYLRAVQLPAAPPVAAASPASPRAAANAASTRTPAAAASQRASIAPPAVSRDLLDLKAGQQLSGISVRLAEGAVSFSGRIVPAEGAAPPSFAQMRVHLVPAEREHADDPLRFYEAAPDASGVFMLKNLAPGRYLIFARTAPDTDAAAARPAAWDTDSRAKLRREAEAAATPAELQPCQRTTDFTLRFPSPPK